MGRRAPRAASDSVPAATGPAGVGSRRAGAGAPGDPNTTFETELYDLLSDPLELTNVASVPANAQRLIDMAARLRQIRPAWPGDSDSTVEDPDE